MKHFVKQLLGLSLVLLLSCFSALRLQAAEQTSSAVTNLLNRIGGEGTADRFVTLVDASLQQNGKDVFTITSQDGKPCIKGSSVLAVTTGINWYLNHYAHVNLAWNNLTTDLSAVSLPVPTQEEIHVCSADYRYYLNYCTFSYSMSTWTWERWQQEIDWMALHGINMPLQIVGLDVVWKNLLTKDLGYTSDEANKFVAGPCFQAWWGMNNLEGWGGPNPDWWYVRQEKLAKKILARERELGMQPVLPGYAGMVPSDIESKKGYKANNQGQWCMFTRPYILDPNSTAFTEISEKYYQRLAELMGTSDYYSMDPFHEGANTDGIDVASAYDKIAQAMTKANANGKWVAQYWQWSGAQYNILSHVAKGKLIILDLYSDAHTHFGEYQGHDAIYCMLPNFGGRTGTFGRLTKVMSEYFNEKNAHANVKGIGATPEAIEQVPVLYDALFELPWRTAAPDAKTWLADYATSRYGAVNAEAQDAWEKMRNSALNCPTSLQGPQEAVLCARPALTVDRVSSWGGTDIFYNAQDVADAAYKMLLAKSALSGENYSYDLTDFTRQALTDYGYSLLKSINAAATQKDDAAYASRRDAYLQLMLDVDQLLNTNKNFMLGRWTNMARGIADEESGTTESDKQWLELNNARTLITTWGNWNASEYGGLRDYSYREWGGMMKDFYYKRWKDFFDSRDNGTSQPDWFTNDWNWAHNANLSYSDQPVGNTAEVATTLFDKYFAVVNQADGNPYYAYRYIDNDLTSVLNEKALRDKTYTFPLQSIPAGTTVALGIDSNNDGVISAAETTQSLSAYIPFDAAVGKVKACLTLSDGTVLSFKITLKDDIQSARTVSVKTANAEQGEAAIEGTDQSSVTNTDEVTIKATPAGGYDFQNWTDAQGNVISTDNPYTYYGAAEAAFTANFIVNKWGSPAENKQDINDIKSYGQYLTSLDVTQNGGDAQSIYAASECPASLCQSTQIVKAAKGSQVTLHWTSAGGLNYCNLSAYADFNCDGDFDDEGELIQAYGEKSSANNGALNDYTLKVLLPYDVPEGITHIRLRFDGAWAGGYDATTGAMPAKSETYRMVYDIPVKVTAQASTACTVTVKSSDVNKGTVDANGQPDTYTYKVGEEIVLRSYPVEGYTVKWYDQYGRLVPESWVDGNFLRFHAPESGTYTAEYEKNLPKQLTLGNWTFDYTTENGAITLVKAISGEGELNIPSQYDGHDIVTISDTALQNQANLTSLSLPATITSLGNTGIVMRDEVNGAGVQDAPIALTHALKANQAWQVNFKVASDGSSFNQWGSALLATGGESLAAIYNNGFQLYLKADGSVILKMGGDEKHTFNISKGAEAFDVKIDHSAANDLTITLSTATDSESYTEQNASLADINQFCTALPAGISLENLVAAVPELAENPLQGCAQLAALSVAEGNSAYEAEGNVLLSADGKVLVAFPEGNIAHAYQLPQRVKIIACKAFTDADELDCIVPSAAIPTVLPQAFGENAIRFQTSEANIVTTRQATSQPVVVSLEEGTALSESTELTQADAVRFNVNGTQTCATAPSLSTDVPAWLTVEANSDVCTPITFPSLPTRLSVEGLSVKQTPLSAVKFYAYNEGKFVEVSTPGAGSYLVAYPQAWNGRKVTFHFAHMLADAALATDGLSGNPTPSILTTTQRHYAYDAATNVFTLQPEGETATLYPFGALLFTSASDAPQTIAGPGTTSSIRDAQGTSALAPSHIYDVQGRKQSTLKHHAPGTYIVNGHKVVVK